MSAHKVLLNYDNKHDVLYVSLGTPKPSYCDEDIEGVLIRRAINTNRVSGVTIMDFSKKAKEQLLKIIPFKIDINELYTVIEAKAIPAKSKVAVNSAKKHVAVARPTKVAVKDAAKRLVAAAKPAKIVAKKPAVKSGEIVVHSKTAKVIKDSLVKSARKTLQRTASDSLPPRASKK